MPRITSHWVVAKGDQTCPWCIQGVKLGDFIGRLATQVNFTRDGRSCSTNWVHKRCYDELPDKGWD